MAKVGAQRAAELTGKSKSTIQRAMKSGKISYEIDANGRRVVDVAELERAFGLIPQQSETKEKETMQIEIERATNMLEMERLKLRIKVLEEQLDTAKEQIEDLKGQRDQWQKQAQQVLITSQYSQKQAEDLKQKLDEQTRRIREKRQQELERRMKAMQAQNENRGAGGKAPALGQSKGGPAGQKQRRVKPSGQRKLTNSQGQSKVDQNKGFDLNTLINRFIGEPQKKKASGGGQQG